MRLKFEQHVGEYPLIIEAEPGHLNQYLERNKQIKIGTSIGNYFTIYVPKENIHDLYKQTWIRRIEDGLIEMRPLLDSARILNNIDSVHSGIAPLTANYKGRNVLVGIIDFGLEWRHLDFKNAPNDSRILALWDQNKDSIPPVGYSYGHLWTKNAIDSGYCRHVANISTSHGTNVTGIAVGNGNSYSPNRGTAPEAKIAFVSLKNNSAWLSNMIDGVHYILKLADSLNLPAVINLSVGTYDGSHDGRDASTRMLEATLNKKGRAIIAASGNAGHMNQHIRFTPNNDTSFSDFTYSSGFLGTYFNFWADTSDVRNLIIGIQADSNPTLLPLSQSYFFPFKSRFLDSLIKYGYYEDSMVVKNIIDSPMGTAIFYVLKQENTVNFQCYIKPKKTTYLWRFSAAGQGKLDMWVHPSLQTTSALYTSPLPTPAVNPAIVRYKLSDQACSIVSGFQCSDKIITVGNYVNKHGIIDIDTIYRAYGGKQNEIASNSSKGPTRDDRIKPDIVATGAGTLTTIDSITGASYAGNVSLRRRLGITGKYVIAGGTSMSSPVVTGTLALLLEKKSDYWSSQLLYLLKKTAKKDSFTTPIANSTYGYGKVDAFRLLSYQPTYGCKDTGSINYSVSSDFEDSSFCVKKVYGCTDTGSINYNPLANVDNGSCIKKVYGCTDTGSINYNPLANVDNGSCIKKVYGCTDTGSINYNPLANVDNGSCIKKVYGCTDTGSINYNPLANVDNDSCIKKVYGCTNPKAINYNPKANVNDGSCAFPPSSIVNYESNKLVIYPNPTDDKIYFHIPSNIKSLDVSLFNVYGIKIRDINVVHQKVVSLENLAKGVYYLVVYTDGTMEKYRILLK
ncbi:MAG: S8 family peptidase [Chitinophagales bacterium]|nr:S8 family peptidase [Chitinophagales bacterium]